MFCLNDISSDRYLACVRFKIKAWAFLLPDCGTIKTAVVQRSELHCNQKQLQLTSPVWSGKAARSYWFVGMKTNKQASTHKQNVNKPISQNTLLAKTSLSFSYHRLYTIA